MLTLIKYSILFAVLLALCVFSKMDPPAEEDPQAGQL